MLSPGDYGRRLDRRAMGQHRPPAGSRHRAGVRRVGSADIGRASGAGCAERSGGLPATLPGPWRASGRSRRGGAGDRRLSFGLGR